MALWCNSVSNREKLVWGFYMSPPIAGQVFFDEVVFKSCPGVYFDGFCMLVHR